MAGPEGAGRPAPRARSGAVAGGSTHWQGRSVISKVVSLLDAFGPGDAGALPGRPGPDTGLPVSTTYRLARELVDWGGLERADGSGLPDRACGCGSWARCAARGGTLRDVALPFMQDLYEATHENVHLAVRDHWRPSTSTRSPAGNRSGAVTTLVAGCRCTRPAWARCCSRTPHRGARRGLEAGLRRYTPHGGDAGPPAPRAGRRAAHRRGLRPRGDEPGLGCRSPRPSWARTHRGRRPGRRRRSGSVDLRRLAPRCGRRPSRLRGRSSSRAAGPDPPVTPRQFAGSSHSSGNDSSPAPLPGASLRTTGGGATCQVERSSAADRSRAG